MFQKYKAAPNEYVPEVAPIQSEKIIKREEVLPEPEM